MTNPIFEFYERTLVAEAVEKHYGAIKTKDKEYVVNKYVSLKSEELEQLLISSAAADSLSGWLKSNQTMSMEQAVLVSKQIDLINSMYPGIYDINLVTTESQSDSDRLTMVAERFNLSIAIAIIASISLILEIIKYFSGPKSANNVLILKTEKKVQSINKTIPKTINEIPKASKICDEKNGTAYSVPSEIIRRATEGELETNKDISALQVLSFFKDPYSFTKYSHKGGFYDQARKYSFDEVFKPVDSLYSQIIKECDSDDDISQSPNGIKFIKEITDAVYGEKSFGVSILKKFFDTNACPSYYVLTNDSVTLLGQTYTLYSFNELKPKGGSRTIIDALDTKQRFELFKRAEDLCYDFNNHEQERRTQRELLEHFTTRNDAALRKVEIELKTLDENKINANDTNKSKYKQNIDFVVSAYKACMTARLNAMRQYMLLGSNSIKHDRDYFDFLSFALTHDSEHTEV